MFNCSTGVQEKLSNELQILKHELAKINAEMKGMAEKDRTSGEEFNQVIQNESKVINRSNYKLNFLILLAFNFCFAFAIFSLI